MDNDMRIVVVGYGAIGQRVLACVRKAWPNVSCAVYSQGANVADTLPAGVSWLPNEQDLHAWKPRLAIECAGHSAVRELAPGLLERGIDVMVVSVGALADAELRRRLRLASVDGGHLLTVSGAIGGLDALSAARSAGLKQVIYTGRKRPQAWQGTPAEERFDLSAITEPTLIFDGSASEAARLYPKNANVTAAVALAGVGFEQTIVRIFADPSVKENVHELWAEGGFGTLKLRLENHALPDNPKTSWLAALSIEAELRRYFQVDVMAESEPRSAGPAHQ